MYNRYRPNYGFGFAAPFLLGTLAGGAISNIFNPYPRLIPMPYNYYGPYYYR